MRNDGDIIRWDFDKEKGRDIKVGKVYWRITKICETYKKILRSWNSIGLQLTKTQEIY